MAGGCSSVIEGRNQAIMVNTNPAGAECGLYRQNLRIATVQNTPSSALIEKSKHDIWVVCVKPGYQQATYFNKSGVAGATVGNFILGGGIGWAIDSASGADNKYDSPVNISMAPNAPGQAEAKVILPETFTAARPPFGTPPQMDANGQPRPAAAPAASTAAATPTAATAPAQVASATPSAALPSPGIFDGNWQIEMARLSTTYGTTVGGECPTSHSAGVTFSNGNAEWPRGKLSLTGDGELSGWTNVPAMGTSMLPFIVNLSGRMDNNVVTGTVLGRCTGSFVMKKL
jgi:hypothetical protein